MSGGHWNYAQRELKEQGQRVAAMFKFMAEAQDQLDWGICGDTCLDCTRLRVVAGLIKYFDDPYDPAAAIVVLKARTVRENKCARCDGATLQRGG